MRWCFGGERLSTTLAMPIKDDVLLSLLRQTFEEGQRSGVFRKDLNAKLVSKILFGALDEMATNWIISKRKYKLEPMAEVVMDVFLNGVSAS